MYINGLLLEIVIFLLSLYLFISIKKRGRSVSRFLAKKFDISREEISIAKKQHVLEESLKMFLEKYKTLDSIINKLREYQEFTKDFETPLVQNLIEKSPKEVQEQYKSFLAHAVKLHFNTSNKRLIHNNKPWPFC